MNGKLSFSLSPLPDSIHLHLHFKSVPVRHTLRVFLSPAKHIFRLSADIDTAAIVFDASKPHLNLSVWSYTAALCSSLSNPSVPRETELAGGRRICLLNLSSPSLGLTHFCSRLQITREKHGRDYPMVKLIISLRYLMSFRLPVEVMKSFTFRGMATSWCRICSPMPMRNVKTWSTTGEGI